jgi:hypothetical protein
MRTDEDFIENGCRNSSSIVVSLGCRSDHVDNILYGHYLATDVVCRIITYQRAYMLDYVIERDKVEGDRF